MSGPHAFPLAAVVEQPLAVEALLLLGVDPGLGGVVIAGRRGTGKSVLARGLQELLPPIRAIKGSCCQADPRSPGDWDDATIARRALLSRNPPSHWIPTPFVQVPLGVSEDRLLGSVDVSRSIDRGAAVFQPGLLAEAHRGVLYIDELNLLDPHIATLLLSTAAEGVNRVEREGISFQHPCRPLLIATYNPAEGELRPHLIDRFAIALSTDTPLTLPQRVEAVRRVLQSTADPAAFAARYAGAQAELRARIAGGRQRLRRVRLQPRQLRHLVEEASRADCEGQRAELFAARVARAHAALQGRRTVEASDLRRAVELVILPRALQLRALPPPPPQEPQPPPAQPPEAHHDDQDKQPPPPSPEPPPAGLPEFVFSPEGVLLDPELLAFSSQIQRRRGKGGGGGVIWSQERGRYVKPVFPHGAIQRVAIDATLRAAAPYQRSRRRRHRAAKGRVWIEDSDLRVKRLARKAGALVVFVVDASGSMALHRMQAAKGAVLRLLEQAYRHRDQMALVVCRGEQASVQLPPTRAIVAASRRLERLPCGGGSPLAHGLALALRLGLNARRSKDIGEVVIVLISDGKANVSLSRSLARAAPGAEPPGPEDPARLRGDLLAIAAAIRSAQLHLLVIDTGNPWQGEELMRELARQAQGRFFTLPRVGDLGLAALAREALQA
jgi:magnesium chelatase subunit D